jgi:Restriction alleviation protein Lar
MANVKNEPVELLPCPFCGEAPGMRREQFGRESKTQIGCKNDDCPTEPTTYWKPWAEAISDWNTRHREEKGSR